MDTGLGSDPAPQGLTRADDSGHGLVPCRSVETRPYAINSTRHPSPTHTRTETSHLLRIRMSPEVKKEAIKVRLVRPGLLEIEGPRATGEEIRID